MTDEPGKEVCYWNIIHQKKKEKTKKNYRVDQNKSFILNMFYKENKLLSSLSKTMS